VSRICLDSNVLVAAFAARGLCADLLRLVLTEQHLVVPEIVADEVRRVLRDKLRVSREAMGGFESVLERCEVGATTGAPAPIHVRDPDDERILAEAVAMHYDLLVTGDDDLLCAAEEPPIPILSPRGFMILARGGSP